MKMGLFLLFGACALLYGCGEDENFSYDLRESFESERSRCELGYYVYKNNGYDALDEYSEMKLYSIQKDSVIADREYPYNFDGWSIKLKLKRHSGCSVLIFSASNHHGGWESLILEFEREAGEKYPVLRNAIRLHTDMPPPILTAYGEEIKAFEHPSAGGEVGYIVNLKANVDFHTHDDLKIELFIRRDILERL